MTQRTVIHLTPIVDGWAVKFDGTKSVISAHMTRMEAEKAAIDLAKSMIPSAVIVHLDNGEVEKEIEFEEQVL
jgi:hypothetical protein